MENLKTPKAMLFGLGLIALAIVSVPYSSMLVKDAHANYIQKGQICGVTPYKEWNCAGISKGKSEVLGSLYILD